MKLYLSSQKIGNHAQQLLRMCGDNKNVAVIINALDDKSVVHRTDRVHKEIAELRSIGLNPEELDLRRYFGRSSDLAKYLESKSLIWIRGGSSFILRRAMIESGFDTAATPLIAGNQLVYGGYSAALLVAGPDLFGVDIVDDIYCIPDGYNKQPAPSSGLGLISSYIIPHEGSKSVWAKNITKHVDLLRSNNYPVITLKDGEVYIKNEEGEGTWK